MKKFSLEKIISSILLFLFFSSLFCCHKKVNLNSTMAGESSCYSWNKKTNKLTIYQAQAGPLLQTIPLNSKGPISGPIQKVALFSTTYVPMFEKLGCLNKVVAIDSAKYSSHSVLKKKILAGIILEVGALPTPDIEKLMFLEVDSLFAPRYAIPPSLESQLKAAGIRCFFFQEWQENSPLARARWVIVAGLLLGEQKKGIKLYQQIKSDYNKEKITISGERIPILTSFPWQGQWGIPGGKSYMAALIHDAGGKVLLNNNLGGSILLDPEVVIVKGQFAPIWLLNSGNSLISLKTLKKNPLYSDFISLKEGHVFNHSKRVNEAGGNDFYESAVLQPNLILRDLNEIIKSFKENRPLNEEKLTYYEPLF